MELNSPRPRVRTWTCKSHHEQKRYQKSKGRRRGERRVKGEGVGWKEEGERE